MNKRLLSALVAVAGESAAAKKIVEEVLTDTHNPLVRELHQRIAKLERMISDLTSSALEPVEVSDEERNELELNLMVRLKDTDWPALARYDRTYLRPYPKEVRIIVATVLRNRAIDLGQQPLDVWLDIIAANGDLK